MADLTTTVDELAAPLEKVVTALLKLPGADNLLVGSLTTQIVGGEIVVYLRPYGVHSDEFEMVRGVARWAALLGERIKLALTFSGGTATAVRPVAGYQLYVSANLSNVLAYRLGEALDGPFNHQHRRLIVTSGELLAACEPDAAVV